MIAYQDTRGHLSKPVHFSQAVLQGLAPGGGLFVPEELPLLSLREIKLLSRMDYLHQALYLYQSMQTDLHEDVLKSCLEKSYGRQFHHPGIAPLHKLQNKLHMLELFHGPSAAFKDMALQCLPHIFEASAEKHFDSSPYLILVATSGDTGSATLSGFSLCKNTPVCVLYPQNGVSQIQKLQMCSQQGPVEVYAVRGNFDECQSIVKQIFNSRELQEQLKGSKELKLTSANSINWGRLLPQIVYYVSAYAQLYKKKELELGEPLNVAVPTGNFGNILAAYYAKRMGVPLGKLYCASNENCVLSDFIHSGVYDIRERKFKPTLSPSMDILISSNLERQLYELSNKNAQETAQYLQQLKTERCFRLKEPTFRALQEHFSAAHLSDDECLAEIKGCLERYGYLTDPHSAVALGTAERLRDPSEHTLVVSTAHWSKFSSTIARALWDCSATDELPHELQEKDEFELAEAVEKRARVLNQGQKPANGSMHPTLKQLKCKPVIHRSCIAASSASLIRQLRQSRILR